MMAAGEVTAEGLKGCWWEGGYFKCWEDLLRRFVLGVVNAELLVV
jgi:hypothetical protein